MVYVSLIDPYSNYIRQHQPFGDVLHNKFSLTCIIIINPAMGWFENVEFLTYDLNEVTGSNHDCIDKSSVRVSQLFNNTWLIR